jgi:ubiquinone/menaquinone biosynthesis C-methylase UbiE
MLKKYGIRFTVILFCLFQASISLSQVGPNDFDVDRAIEIMGIGEGMIIGEAGAGRGFFTFPMAGKVGPEGKVYANDIKNSALEYIRKKCEERSITNIMTVLGEISDPLFPVDDLDMVVIVHAFHDFDQPASWLEHLKKYMKQGSVLAILDRDPDRWGRMHYHFQTKEEVVGLLREAGFKNIKVNSSLKYDNIYLAKKESISKR